MESDTIEVAWIAFFDFDFETTISEVFFSIKLNICSILSWTSWDCLIGAPMPCFCLWDITFAFSNGVAKAISPGFKFLGTTGSFPEMPTDSVPCLTLSSYCLNSLFLGPVVATYSSTVFCTLFIVNCFSFWVSSKDKDFIVLSDFIYSC